MKLFSQVKSGFTGLRPFFLLWLTQSFSSLGSSMTNFALIIWSYQQEGSALTTALLSICSYAPYVLMSIFAGALSDKWNKKRVMLASDSFAAICTVLVLLMLQTGRLEIWHLYCLNALGGLMNTVQQPAADVTITLLTPKQHYQKVSGLRSLSNSLVSILTPLIATSVLAFAGLQMIIAFDLFTFAVAFVSLWKFISIPKGTEGERKESSLWQSVRGGLRFLGQNRGILDMILFLAAINLLAAVYNAAFPAMAISRKDGDVTAFGVVNTVVGVATLFGSMLASFLPSPKSRVRVICNALLLSMSTENLCLALTQSVPLWCVGAALGWIAIPLMNANMDVLFRSTIPVDMQGRVYAARNTLQFFTIPLGYLLGGLLVDEVFEPFMAKKQPGSIWCALFGTGKGSGAAVLFLVLAVIGVAVCLGFRRDSHLWALESERTPCDK